jgi:hypothetical protein
MITKKQQDLDREHDAELAAFELVRSGLGDQDRDGDQDQDQDRKPTEGERLRVFVDSSAPSLERKRALLELSMWARQERFLAAYAACGTITHAAQAAGVSRRTVNDWRSADRLGFLARMDGEAESFADRLEAVAWDLVKRLKPGNSPMLLLAMLNAKRSHQYRPAVQVDPVTARDTLSELRQLASSGAAAEDQAEDRGAAAVAEAERLLGARTVSGPGGHGESGENGADAEHQDQRDQDPGPDGQELDPSGGG